jgi:translocation and assembly module TamB
MTVTGVVPFEATGEANLSVNGNINLFILQLLNSDLLARGNAEVEANIRGTLRNPNVNGRLNLNGASLYLKDVPNGLDNASGSIVFSRNRARIEKLTADIGPGRVTFTGDLEFGGTLVYRLQAEALQVRVRYPEDVFSTFDADLQLNGTSSASRLSGVVTLNRATISQRVDLGRLLAQASQPALAATTPNEYLNSVQLDVKVVNNPNFRLDSPLATGVEVDVDLRVSGSPERPILLGSITVNRGEMQVFGNRYTVDRGDIRFLNPVRIEPSFDIHVTTRARGVTVNVSFSGTIQKMSVNYSSDPPLQQSEIIALLAVGRDPTSAANQVAPGINSGASAFVETGGSLVGQAVSQQVNNRLQRFFGATRVKIDPTLTGVDNLPQARLTFEQQVSKDITLTYITNLNRTTEQIVRFQWDVSSEWSAIAVRDQNGLFGIDFQFRKRF